MGAEERVRLVRPAQSPGLELLYIQDTERPWEGVVEHFVVTIATDPARNPAQSHYRRSRHDGGFMSAMSPGEAHRAVPLGRCSWATVSLTPAMFAALAPEEHASATAFDSHLYDDSVAYDAFRAVHRAHALGEGALTTESLQRRALELLLRNDRGGAKRTKLRQAPAAIERVREILHDRYADDLTVQDLADACGMTREHTLRSFREHYGLPPHRYLMYLRVARARALLAQGYTAGSIATHVGFYDHSHLNRWFRRALGVTPGVYSDFEASARRGSEPVT